MREAANSIILSSETDGLESMNPDGDRALDARDLLLGEEMSEYHGRREVMKMKPFYLGLIIPALLAVFVTGCYQQPGKGPQKSPAVGMVLKAPQDAQNRSAAMKNDEGVSHLLQEHWDTSNKFFREAIQADPNLAVAYFNLALSLDEMGLHAEATEHFGKAKELAPDDARIADNEILKKHL